MAILAESVTTQSDYYITVRGGTTLNKVGLY